MALDSIRSEYRNGRTLPQVLANYLGDSAPENRFSRHWIRFLEAKSQDAQDGEITSTRYRELESYERRGYLDSLWDLSVFQISFGVLDDWRRELQRRHSARGGRLSRKTIRHVVSDVGTFLRWLHRRKDLEELPELPTVSLGERQRPSIPSEEMLKNYLASIPEQKRGLWLIRAHNGLRPSEARELNVQDYDFQRDTVTLRHSKKSGPRNEVELVTFAVDWEVAQWVQCWVDPRDAVRGYAPLFQNPDSYNDHHRWTPASERRVHVAACAEIGAYFKPNHCGRHAFGTHAMRRLKERTGAYDIAAVQKAMRHADPRTTQGYIDRDVIDIVHVLRPKGP